MSFQISVGHCLRLNRATRGTRIKPWLGSLEGLLRVILACLAPTTKADPVPIDWFMIGQCLGQFQDRSASSRPAEIAVRDLHSCANPFMNWYELGQGAGARLINTKLLAAYVSNRALYLWADDCTAGGCRGSSRL